jgi:mRNA-degrading endonuclease YafQ of YafQ-DinJ toxin-antitoxin module
MFQVTASKSYQKELGKLIRRDTKIRKQVIKTLSLLSQDPKHPSLRLHKITGRNYFTVSVNMDIRMIVKIEGVRIFLLKIGTHDEVY